MVATPFWMLGCLSDMNTKPSGSPIATLSWVRNQVQDFVPLWIYDTPRNGIAIVVTVLTSCDQQGSLACGLQEGTIQIDHSPHARKSPYLYVKSHKKYLNLLLSSTFIQVTVPRFFNFNMWQYNGRSGKLSLGELLIRECAYCFAFQPFQ